MPGDGMVSTILRGLLTPDLVQQGVDVRADSFSFFSSVCDNGIAGTPSLALFLCIDELVDVLTEFARKMIQLVSDAAPGLMPFFRCNEQPEDKTGGSPQKSTPRPGPRDTADGVLFHM